MKPLKFIDIFLKSIAAGFLLSFLSVIAAIVFAINDSTSETPLSTHFLIWVCGTIFAFIFMLWIERKKSSKN
jgi:hypothetical protein